MLLNDLNATEKPSKMRIKNNFEVRHVVGHL